MRKVSMKRLFFISFLLLIPAQYASAGRYEFHQNVQFSAQSVLLDTQTGKMWKMTCFTEAKDGDCAIKAWAPVDIVGVTITAAEVGKAVDNYNKSNQGK